MQHGYRYSDQVSHRTIWVRRDNNALECKTWFIYSFPFIGQSAHKIQDFLAHEQARYAWPHPVNPADLQRAAADFQDLNTTDPYLPPRLPAIAENELSALDTALVTNAHDFVLGDSVGGLAPDKPHNHNLHLHTEITEQDIILFNPGVLGRVTIEQDGKTFYIFQLSPKNLLQKGCAFYKPIGGHLKVWPDRYNALVERYELITKDTSHAQDQHDVSFGVKARHFSAFNDLFLQDTLINRSFAWFEDPALSMQAELAEELGPVPSFDGINLLSAVDLQPL